MIHHYIYLRKLFHHYCLIAEVHMALCVCDSTDPSAYCCLRIRVSNFPDCGPSKHSHGDVLQPESGSFLNADVIKYHDFFSPHTCVFYSKYAKMNCISNIDVCNISITKRTKKTFLNWTQTNSFYFGHRESVLLQPGFTDHWYAPKLFYVFHLTSCLEADIN